MELDLRQRVKRGIGLLATGQLLVMTCMLAGALAENWQLEAARKLKQALRPPLVSEGPDCPELRFDLRAAVVRFYEYRGYAPAWVDRYGLLPEGAMALAAVKQADRQGLVYSDYRQPWLESVLGGMLTRPVILGAAFDGQQIQCDLVITETVLRYVWHLTMGRTAPDMLHYGLPWGKPLPQDLVVALAVSLENGRLAQFLAQLGPRHKAYRALQKKMPPYQKIKLAGGWPAIDDGPALQPGDCGGRVVQLRNRLVVSGDAPADAGGRPDCFDDALAAAVARFQHRHGLFADGVAGGRTLAALNVSVEQRIRQIRLNLERWRWMPEDLGSRHVLVNIPGYQMQVIDAGQVIKTMRTIVGRKRRPTPVLSSRITYLEINPYWYVPPLIARKDLLPKIQANPEFLVRQNFRVFDSWDDNAREINPAAIDWSTLSEDHFPFRLRQEPASHNALGRVKFMFPNELSVYIHDTPSKGLFKRSSRPFSSGCVRVEEPMELVSLLLNRKDWDQARLSDAVASNQRQVIILDEPVPVHLIYLTAWVAADGETHFREDIYGHDRALISNLAQRSVAQQACRAVTRHPVYIGAR